MKKGVKSLQLLRSQGVIVSCCKPVKRGIIGNEGRLVKLDSQPEEEGEVRLHLGKLIRCQGATGIGQDCRHTRY